MSQFASLPYKATGKHGSIIHMRTGRYDKIIANNAVPDMYRRVLVTVDTSVVQTTRTTNVAIVANADILDRAGIEYHYMAADRTGSRSMLIGIEIGNFLHPRNQLRTVTVQRHDIGLMSRKFVTDKHFAPTGLVQDRHFHTVTEPGQSVYKNNVYILNESIMPYFIIGNVVLDILDAAIITHRYIVKRYMPQTGMFLYSTRQSKFRMEYPQTHLTRKTGMMYEFR